MEWGLFVLAVTLVALLQFAVWRRLQNGDVDTPDADTTDATDSPRPPEHTAPGETARQQSDGDVTTCPNCGADNETGYRFCRQCANSLYL